ncbi:MAG: SAM-dependent methyltransferase [Caldilineae bacterium]|nr:SAM-dependent methyltransferase [Caldilineae bacterium]
MTPSKESIVDATVPSAGRIYDYLLGGHHNFEVDRQAAQMLLNMSPFSAKLVRLQRWCLQDLAHELTVVRGFDTIIDFASGLPTQDHLHFVVPKGTKVIYSDYDPVVVEYAREILGNTPDVYFFEADARQPEELLGRPEVVEILGNKRNVALVYWGIAMFLSDEDLSRASQALYDWAGTESCWAFNAQGAGISKDHPGTLTVLEMYRNMGTPLYVRERQEYEGLLKPWHPDSNGFISLLDWHGFEQDELSKEDLAVFGPTGAGYGVYLLK